ncbi:hypothetical protein D3C71_1603380 [compost metagenome]
MGFTGQAHEGFGDVEHLWPQEQIVIQIARLGLIAAIGQMVVVDLITQIQPAAAQVVIEQAKADLFPARDGKRDMLVERIGAGGVVAHRVQVTHFKAAAGTLQIARFFT